MAILVCVYDSDTGLVKVQKVGSAQIGDGAIVSGKLASGAVTTVNIADGAVTSAKIASGFLP